MDHFYRILLKLQIQNFDQIRLYRKFSKNRIDEHKQRSAFSKATIQQLLSALYEQYL